MTKIGIQREWHVKIAVMLAQVKEPPEARRGLKETDPLLEPSGGTRACPCLELELLASKTETIYFCG